MRVLERYHPRIRPEDQKELISVIVTACNVADYIEKSVRSVCAQTYRNLEILVVDDGSTDATGRICDGLAGEDARIRVIHKKNGGVADARNEGMRAVRGSYIGFVDGDDWIDPDMYEQMLGTMREQKADAAICRYRQVHSTGTLDESQDRVIVFEGQEALQHYVWETRDFVIQNATWNKLYKKEMLEGLLFPTGRLYEDILFTTKALSRVECCVYLDTALYNYIIDREGSIMNAWINERTFTDHIPAYREKTAFLRSIGRDDLAKVHDYFTCKRLLLFYHQVEGSNLPEKDRYLAKLGQILRDGREAYTAACTCPQADARDGKWLKLFFKSPARYSRRVRIEERVVIPCKVKIKRLLRR